MRKIFAFCFILFTLCSIGIAQNTQPPAYAMMERYNIELVDSICKPLTYIDSETGQGNLVVSMVEAVKNKQIVAYSPDDDRELTWDEVQDALGRKFDTVEVFDYPLNGVPFTGWLTFELPYNLSEIIYLELSFIVIYDKSRNVLSRELISLTPYRSLYDMSTGDFMGYRGTICLKMNNSNFHDILYNQKSMLPGYKHKSYLQVINDFISVDILQESRYASFCKVNSILSDTLYPMPISKSNFEFPNSISDKKSKLVVRKILLPIVDVGNECLSRNYFLPIFGNPIDMAKEAGDISYFPLFYPNEPDGCGFASVSRLLADESMKNVLSFYKYDSLNYFVAKMDGETAKSCFAHETLIEVQDPISENPDSVFYYSIREELQIAGFYILELHNGKSVYALGICPLIMEGEYEESQTTALKPVCWIPFNAGFRALLQSQEAYWPGKLPVMSLWDYFCANYYGGEIISEQKITQAEWAKMLEVLQ